MSRYLTVNNPEDLPTGAWVGNGLSGEIVFVDGPVLIQQLLNRLLMSELS